MAIKIEQYDLNWNFDHFEGELRTVTAEEVSTKMNGNRLVEGVFAEDQSIGKVIFPDNIEDIGEVAFFGCQNLSEANLPKGLKFIREEAFAGSGLETVVVPESVELIGEKAFLDCPHLQSADVLGVQTHIDRDAFGTCPKLLEGYIARGYPTHTIPPEELFYTLMWCTCPNKHLSTTRNRAINYIQSNTQLILERIFKFNNVAAMRGLVSEGLLGHIDLHPYISEASNRGMVEISTLLLSAARQYDNISISGIDNDPFAL